MKKGFSFKILFLAFFITLAAIIKPELKAKETEYFTVRNNVDIMYYKKIAFNEGRGILLAVLGKLPHNQNLSVTVVDHSNLIQEGWYSKHISHVNLPQYNWQKITFDRRTDLNDDNIFASTHFVATHPGTYHLNVNLNFDGQEYNYSLPVEVTGRKYSQVIEAPKVDKYETMVVDIPTDETHDEKVIHLRGSTIDSQVNKIEVIMKYNPDFDYQGLYLHHPASSPFQEEHLAGAKYAKYTFHAGASYSREIQVCPYFIMDENYRNYNVRFEVYEDGRLVDTEFVN